MTLRREFRRVTFDRKLDVKRLRAALSLTMREAMKAPSRGASPARPESVRIEGNRTTVFLSGSAGGLNAVGRALRMTFPDATFSKASRRDAARPPASLSRSRRRAPRRRRRT